MDAIEAERQVKRVAERRARRKAEDFWLLLCVIVSMPGAIFLGLGQPAWSLQFVTWGVPLSLAVTLIVPLTGSRYANPVSGVSAFALVWLLLLGLTASFGWLCDAYPLLTFFGVFALLGIVVTVGFILALVRLF